MMNVKCPNCRLKFDVTAVDVNENNEVNCTCPRCGKSFTTELIRQNAEPIAVGDSQVVPSVDQPQAEVQESEANLHYALMKRMNAGQLEEATVYLNKLLRLNPNEPTYLGIKEQLDKIQNDYLLATKYLNSGKLNLAIRYINNLLQVNPNDPMYLSLKEAYDEAKQVEDQRQEEERQMEEARKKAEEEARKREEEEKKKKAQEVAQTEEKRKRKLRLGIAMKITMGIFAAIITLLLLIDLFFTIANPSGRYSAILTIVMLSFFAVVIINILHLVWSYKIIDPDTSIKQRIKSLLPLWLSVFFLFAAFCFIIDDFSYWNVFTNLYFSFNYVFGADFGSLPWFILLLPYIAIWYYCCYGFWITYRYSGDLAEEKILQWQKRTKYWASIVLVIIVIQYIFMSLS